MRRRAGRSPPCARGDAGRERAHRLPRADRAARARRPASASARSGEPAGAARLQPRGLGGGAARRGSARGRQHAPGHVGARRRPRRGPDIVRGLPNVPPGKKPVVLTFDDSDISQFRVLENNLIDAESGMGVLLDFHNRYPGDWPTRSTFFILGNDTANYSTVFGQPNWAKAKATYLVEMGMELGSHTVNHTDLSVATAERIYWELAISQHVIEGLVPGYEVESLSVPYGGFPHDDSFLESGSWGEYSYDYNSNAAAWGGPTVSPFDEAFNPYRIARIEVTQESLDMWLAYFEQNPGDYYVSDGDPERLTFPQLEETIVEPAALEVETDN
ncbi:MAG: polysaccharide deacetylase family protein [Chloroflexota bacterium]